MPRTVDIDVEKAYRMKLEGYSLEAIGEELGVSLSAVRDRLISRYGKVPLANKGRKPRSIEPINVYDQFIKNGLNGIWIVSGMDDEYVHLKSLYKHKGPSNQYKDGIDVTRTDLALNWKRICKANVKTYNL